MLVRRYQLLHSGLLSHQSVIGVLKVLHCLGVGNIGFVGLDDIHAGSTHAVYQHVEEMNNLRLVGHDLVAIRGDEVLHAVEFLAASVQCRLVLHLHGRIYLVVGRVDTTVCQLSLRNQCTQAAGYTIDQFGIHELDETHASLRHLLLQCQQASVFLRLCRGSVFGKLLEQIVKFLGEVLAVLVIVCLDLVSRRSREVVQSLALLGLDGNNVGLDCIDLGLVGCIIDAVDAENLDAMAVVPLLVLTEDQSIDTLAHLLRGVLACEVSLPTLHLIKC